MTTDERVPVEPSGPGGSTRHPGMVRVKVRVRRNRRRRRLLILGALLVALVAGIAMALLARPLLSAKHEAQAAQADLTSAKEALSDNRLQEARGYVDQARAHVDQAQREAGGLGGDVWSRVPVAGGAVDDERHLVDALDQTTSVAELGVKIYPIVSGRSAQLVRGQRIDLGLLREVADRTTAIGPHLDQAMSDLDQVSGTTPFVGGSVTDAKNTALDYLVPLQKTYRSNEPLIRSLPRLVGAEGPRTYLLAMLNPAELRYSGGGALSFTTMRFDHGVATFGRSVNVDDIGARGARQRWQPVPGNTFHRRQHERIVNSTFSPWWSVSGEELLRGYRKAFPGPAFNGMIAIDLQGLASLFKVTGPIDLPSFGEITSDNIVKTLAGSYGNFDSIEQRHRLNAQLVPAFRERFFEGGQMSDKVKSLVESAKGRHFAVYFRDPRVQRSFARVGLSGDLSRSPYDYIGVFSQNLNGSKTDYWQRREVTSTVHLRPDGGARTHLRITVSNQAPAYDLPVPDPKFGYTTQDLGTLVGVFMPRDSRLESASVNGKRTDVRVHRTRVPNVLNRKYIQKAFLLNYGQSGTFDVGYRTQRGAEVLDPHTMIYRLDVDPQPLVSAQIFHVQVTWPNGFRPSGTLPVGWKVTKEGARFDGAVTTQTSWAIPLTKR